MRNYLLLILCIFAVKIHATHIVGGEILYKHLQNDTYQIQLNLFVDCLNGNPGAIAQDATALFYIFSEKNNVLLPNYPISISRNIPSRIAETNYKCINNTPNACVDFYIYTTKIYLPRGKGNYIVSFQRCCRNNSINNLISPGSTGANYWTTIPDPYSLPDSIPNSSAVFSILPPNFLCTNALFESNHNATDSNNDSLSYELFLPFEAATTTFPRPDNGANGACNVPPFTNVVYSTPYTFLNPIDGNPALSINNKTGKLTIVPTKTGQFVVGIIVKEFRKGKLISVTRRDYQFNIFDCIITVKANFNSADTTCNDTVIVTPKSNNAQVHIWNVNNKKIIDSTLVLKPVIQLPKSGKYFVQLIVKNKNCVDTFSKIIVAGKTPKGSLVYDVNPCTLDAVINALSIAPKYFTIVENTIYTEKIIRYKLKNKTTKVTLYISDSLDVCKDSVLIDINSNMARDDYFLSNVFTPNNDGKNDCFSIRFRPGIADCTTGKLTIYNRWGQKIFYSESLTNCWNGTINNTGAALPSGTYFYKLIIDSALEKEKTLNGTIQLIR